MTPLRNEEEVGAMQLESEAEARSLRGKISDLRGACEVAEKGRQSETADRRR
jgi:hypothetical protein